MSTAQQVIDEIGALVDEQMAGGEPEVGYSYGDPTFPRCTRCAGRWHGLPRGGCPGSDVEGPLHQPGMDDLRESVELIAAAFRGVSEVVVDAFRSLEAMFLPPLDIPEPPSRCTLAARRRMHSDQLRVQRRAARRERRARRRSYARPGEWVEVHDDHLILTLIPDVSGFRRELRRDV